PPCACASTHLSRRSPLSPYTSLFRSRHVVDELALLFQRGPIPVHEIDKRSGRPVNIEALPASGVIRSEKLRARIDRHAQERLRRDRKSTRLNSSHQIISYAVFCLIKK